MTRPKLFLALAGGVLGCAVAVSAPPPHHGGSGRPAGPVGRPIARPPAMHPAPSPMAGRPPVSHPNAGPVVGRPPTGMPNGHLGALSPAQGFRPSLNPVAGGGGAVRPFSTGPKPLLTNPHPNAAPVRAARSTAATRQHWAHASGVAGLAAVSGKSPAEVALFLASQRNSHDPLWNGWGWGSRGWGGWGYSGWGFYGVNPFGFFPWGYGSGFGIGFGYHSGPWAFGLGYNFGYSPVMSYVPVYDFPAGPAVAADANPPLLPQPDAAVPPADAVKPAATDFAQQGQELFMAGKYADAVKALRHAVVDDPTNGPLLALTGEALWANGNYNEAAGAIQQSLLATPETDWVGVSSRAARLIPAEAVGNLARAIGDKESPELRFLAGYQSFGAGKFDEAAAHLDLLLKKAPDDAVAKKLRDQAVKLAAGK